MQELNIFLERPLKLCGNAYWNCSTLIQLDNSFEVAVIHIAISDIVNNKNPLNTDHMLQNIKNITQKCKIYGI